MLSDFEWELLNKIIFRIYSEESLFSMRKVLVENLRALIDFDVAEFSLVNEELRLYNSVEINMMSNEVLNIAEKYNQCKEIYGADSTNYIFRYPQSFVAANLTTTLRGISYENTKFYKFFVKSIGMKYCCTLTLRSDDFLLGELSLYRSSDPDFNEKDIYILNQKLSHLELRMFKLCRQHNTARLSKSQLNYLLKSMLTDREIQIVELILSDMSNSQIASNLCISINTLKKHTSNIYKKLNVSTRNQLKLNLLDL